MNKPMVFETDLLLERTEGDNNLMVDIGSIQVIVPIEKVRRLLDKEIDGATLSISTGKINKDQEPFITSTGIMRED